MISVNNKEPIITDLQQATHSQALHADLSIVDNTDKHFKGQQSNEEVICFFRRHWVSLLPTVLIFLLLSIFIGFALLGIMSGQFSINNEAFKTFYIFFFIFTTIYIHKFFINLINFFGRVFILTNTRFVEIHKTTYLRSTQDSMDLRLIEDVNKRQIGLIKNILNYGELVITLSDFGKTIIYVPNPDFHFRVINKAMQSAKMGQPIKIYYGTQPGKVQA